MTPYLMLFFFLCALTPAHAYLDPSSGGMLLQILLGGFAGLFAVGKIYWQNVKDFFARFLSRKN
jgi:hypothetical protein